MPNLTVTSTSIRHLIFQSVTCSTLKLAHLCQQTPNLEQLSIIFNDESNQLEFISPILSLTRLKILSFHSIDIDVLKHLLQHIPNLYQLTMEMYDVLINGYQWEEIIRNYLPKLKIFQFRMTFLPSPDKDKEVQLNEIVDTYRTKFWIDEHQWFVQCHLLRYDKPSRRYYIDLFTLPYAFTHFPNVTNCVLSKSTYPYDNQYLTWDRVTYLHYQSSYFPVSILSHIRFSNIQSLSLPLPFHDLFLSIVSRLDRLISLAISISNKENVNYIQSQLQLLLHRAVRLHSLRCVYCELSNRQLLLMEITSTSVRRLDLQDYTFDNQVYGFNDEQCIQLTHSPLAIQCQTLSIRVINRRNIIYLLNNMSNLQALTVQSQDDKRTEENNLTSPINDELLQWLRQQLPSTFTIIRDTLIIENIRLWIR